MTRAFVLYLLGAYLFRQWRTDCVFKVAGSLPCLWEGSGGELGLGLSCLPVLFFGHTWSGDSMLAGGTLEAPWDWFFFLFLYSLSNMYFLLLQTIFILMSSRFTNCNPWSCKQCLLSILQTVLYLAIYYRANYHLASCHSSYKLSPSCNLSLSFKLSLSCKLSSYKLSLSSKLSSCKLSFMLQTIIYLAKYHLANSYYLVNYHLAKY